MNAVGRYVRSNHLGLLAIFIALGGTSYAAVKLPKNSVGAKQIKKNAVTGTKVKNGSLLSADFKAGQLPAGQNGAPGSQGAQGPQGPAGKDGAAGKDGTNGTNGLIGPTGPKGDDGLSTGPAGGSLAGTYPNPSIKAGAVGAAEIAGAAITGAKIATNAVSATELADDSVGSGEIQADAVGTSELKANSVGSGLIIDNSVTGTDVLESSLSGVDAATLGGSQASAFASVGGSTANSLCTDDAGLAGGSECGTEVLAVPRVSRILAMVSGTAKVADLNDTSGAGNEVDLTDRVIGTCRLKANNDNIGPEHDFLMRDGDELDNFSIIATSSGTFTGNVTLKLICSEVDGDIDWQDIVVTAVALAGTGS